MSCVEKRHASHRVGSMLHHRFPNGFTDMFMDETDREVSTLTDRAFRSLCVGDDAVYNDEFFYGYSPFSCHKPLVGEAPKKTHHKDCKKHGQSKSYKNDAQQWKQQQDENLSHMSSFLKALSVTEESCEELLNKNGGMTDSNGESWDKSALRSIQKELSDFSSYQTNLTDEQCKNHHLLHFGNGSSKKTGKDTGLPSGKPSKLKNGKSTVKLKKLNIKNFFLHSELSPFQTWKDVNRFPFGPQETSILPIDNIPKWYDLSFYKELTEADTKDAQLEETQSCQKAAVEPPPPTAPKPVPPPKVLPKPSASLAEKRCSSDGVNESAAPWRCNRSRAKSAIQINQPGNPSQDKNSGRVDGESLLLANTESRSVAVKAVEEASSLASTPFSICQLMTPLIPSRQPTETSEILSSSALDLPLRPHSEAKVVPEPPVKRDSYKSLAFSILFNLKDNRKRVKSRYSPRKFKTLELPEGGSQSPQSDYVKNTQAGSEGNASGLSTPAILKDGQTFCSPTLEPTRTSSVGLAKLEADRPLSDDYLLSNLLLSKREALGTNGCGEENPISPFLNSKKNKSPMTNKQNYPSLSLYKKASPVDDDMKYLQELSPKALQKNTELSPNALNVTKGHKRSSSNIPAGKRPPNVPEKPKQLMKDKQESGLLPSSKGKDTSDQRAITMDVIRAAREAINAEKSKALSVTQSAIINKSDMDEVKETETDMVACEMFSSKRGSNSNVKKEPPPVPKRNVHPLDQQATHTINSPHKSESSPKESESALKQDQLKRVFSAKQNNYIKHQRCAVGGDEQVKDYVEGDLNVNTGKEMHEEIMLLREKGDSEQFIHDLRDLKELERARLGDHVVENATHKLGVMSPDEEARMKNDLISRELRNIKKGMLSMRGNTLAKKELFAKKDKELGKPEAFTKIDSNVMVNKALINDNYDKAKMALEEIIAERQKRNKTITEHDANAIIEENASDECCTKVQQSKEAMEKSMTGGKDKLNDCTFALKEKDLKERLDDLRDHKHMRQILAQTEPTFGESQRWGGRIVVALPGLNETGKELNALLRAKVQHVRDSLTNTPSFDSEEINLGQVTRQVSDENGEILGTDTGGKRLDAPLVPPRNKKGGGRRDGGVAKETDNLQESVFANDLDKKGAYETDDEYLMSGIDLEKLNIDCDRLTKQPSQREAPSEKEMWDAIFIAKCLKPDSATGTFTCEPTSPSQSQSINNLCSSPPFTKEKEANNSEREEAVESGISKIQESCKLKRKAPLKPDYVNTPNYTVTSNPVAEDQTEKIIRHSEEANVDADVTDEIPPNVVSPLLFVNGISVDQSPPDQSSLSSKSSYFSAESALHRNTETESNVYHSLENLVSEVEEVIEGMQNVSQRVKRETDRTEVDYYALSDRESESEVVKQTMFCPKEAEALHFEGRESENNTSDQSQDQDRNDKTPMSPSNTFSPALGVPSLFKVKDNTFSNKSRKTVQPWSRTTSLSGLERGEEELHQIKDNPDLPLADETTPIVPAGLFEPKETLSNHSLPLLSPTKVQNENLPKAQDQLHLTVPQEDDRFSEVSPASEGLESLTTSTADTADEAGTKAGKPLEHEAPHVSSERSGSTCSGNESQAGLPKPPAVLPKSEKAVLKAIKLANRRMRKEESQNPSSRSSQSSSKHRAERHKDDKSEIRSNRSNEKKNRERIEDSHHQSGNHHRKTNKDSSELLLNRGGIEDENLDSGKADRTHRTWKQSQKGKIHDAQAQPGFAAERQGRSSDRHTRHKPDHRHYSCDRVISNVPVYKARVGERPMSDRPLNRSQSIDRYLEDKTESKSSADLSVREILDPRTLRMEKSIMDELQHRGRARDRASTENLLRRSHSIDAYSAEVSHPPPVSRQSSHTSQFSRQSSIEHTIVTQSFPMTQRKLLQDPDSGQYFFVDMPVQVKTKTFFDPETGSYVQLPVQPTEGAVPQASPLEVLTPPLVVYHGFVPVPLSPLAQKGTIQAAHVEPEEQRCLERPRHYQEGHAYLEPLYGQSEQMLGEFLGTEELDCPS